MTSLLQIEAALDQLGDLNRTIAALGEELVAVRAAAVNEHVRAMRALADQEEMANKVGLASVSFR